jgi:hypothetical protein
MKAIILIYILNGDPVFITSMNLIAECNNYLIDLKLGASKTDAELYRCVTQDQYIHILDARRAIVYEESK